MSLLDGAFDITWVSPCGGQGSRTPSKRTTPEGRGRMRFNVAVRQEREALSALERLRMRRAIPSVQVW